MTTDQRTIREVLKELHPSSSHRAADKPRIEEIYTPPRHAEALDPQRALVIGGRGVGKSFWAAVLYDEHARKVAAEAYPRLGLDKIDVALGFHEAALGTQDVAPSPAVLKAVLAADGDPGSIWKSVLLKALAPDKGPQKLKDRVAWIEDDPENFEDMLKVEDDKRAKAGRKLLLVFDALDVMSNDWETIRELTRGLAKLALEMSARRAIRLKLFMRRDQFEDMKRKTFVDFSKLQTAAVQLEWSTVDLYGALFTHLWRDPRSNSTIRSLGTECGLNTTGSDLPRLLKTDESKQQMLFSSFAGEYMGKNARRGRTYTWVPKHLADAYGETSLRSFFIALRTAAETARDNDGTAIDYTGINTGVLKASDTRCEELNEDHPWIKDALEDLRELTVPCTEKEIIERWRKAKTVNKILKRTDNQRPAAPIQLGIHRASSPESSLVQALIDIGVIEKRSQTRINVPDIFRVAAKMKRKGGVAPRKQR